ncbi:hypothetical protein GOC83_19500 [Haloarcula rubripromontorii]|uniref:Resolvase HTH domain-containing protein n=1 Tax=Haloarcula rubripromontorii TaxID=1705562 RepID=A0A847U6S4_9EURY|nr:hypothetical protein [Haloarcula rubripromontorii]NLV08306.1 hypothetical protein [Haloarcula rubripromontorii]
MTDPDSQTATTNRKAEIVAALDLSEFTPDAYTDPSYLAAALDAGFDVADLAIAHEVSKRTIYRAINRHDIEHETPPKNGPARRLWNSYPDTISGDD